MRLWRCNNDFLKAGICKSSVETFECKYEHDQTAQHFWSLISLLSDVNAVLTCYWITSFGAILKLQCGRLATLPRWSQNELKVTMVKSVLLLWRITSSKYPTGFCLRYTWTRLFLMDFTWKVSLSSLTMTPTVWGSNCTSSPHSCWPPASTPDAVSEHSCKSRGKTFNWSKKRHHIRQRTHNIDNCILCIFSWMGYSIAYWWNLPHAWWGPRTEWQSSPPHGLWGPCHLQNALR